MNVKGNEMEVPATVSIEEQVRYFWDVGRFFVEQTTDLRAGRTREEIVAALLSKPQIYAFRFERIATTTIRVEEEEISLTSEPFKLSSLIYVGGAIYTLEELEHKQHIDSDLLRNVQANQPARAIQTRTGRWTLFYPDKDMHTPEKSLD